MLHDFKYKLGYYTLICVGVKDIMSSKIINYMRITEVIMYLSIIMYVSLNNNTGELQSNVRPICIFIEIKGENSINYKKKHITYFKPSLTKKFKRNLL